MGTAMYVGASTDDVEAFLISKCREHIYLGIYMYISLRDTGSYQRLIIPSFSILHSSRFISLYLGTVLILNYL